MPHALKRRPWKQDKSKEIVENIDTVSSELDNEQINTSAKKGYETTMIVVMW